MLLGFVTLGLFAAAGAAFAADRGSRAMASAVGLLLLSLLPLSGWWPGVLGGAWTLYAAAAASLLPIAAASYALAAAFMGSGNR